ncbi:hypothetical protein AD16_4662 [Escherichia coli 3-267-03_S4_C2]|uniref:Uncharacterized protein n=2 Tax=Escherichia coli TaxID=562 RepID=A0AAN3M6F0_ECOLX|nr:hypothetical protein EcHS_A0221 [Escherichia coli HS]EDU95722.1 hypothetical protein ECH7EC508_5531 [Escherichia coli O157:H7 str. EC508]EFK66708.1 hypothetical protein HMPREF9347_04394 [Escherichia coli MS 124-1]EFU33498.1 hypothetical protein HMPREF9350_04644 [Escherichia coli MS 85-1]EGJ07043.1 hypothetical protein SSJG_03092 [Escherichia coli D9]EIN51847.1 hypothetical protein ECFRIK1985_0207 [Escherichia coli FRIK1985]EIN67872.1 hypothetical protein ECPA9_0356 [Escherichia coli PA9]E
MITDSNYIPHLNNNKQNQFEIYIHLININLFSGNIFKLNGSISLLNFNE